MALAVLSAVQKAAAVEAASSDIKYHLSEIGVAAEVQEAVFHSGVTSLRLLSGLDESRDLVRECLKTELGLDSADGMATRKQVALLISAWEASKLQVAAEDSAKMEAKANHWPRPVGVTEHAAMRKAVRARLGTLNEKEVPGKAFIGTKLEQVENNEPRVEDLRDVASLDDGESEFLTGLVETSGAVKVRKGSNSIAPPKDAEALRLRHRRIGLAWMFVSTKHKNRPWLADITVEDYRVHSDYILGQYVNGLVSKNSQGQMVAKVTWQGTLDYDHEVRKKAYELVRSGLEVTVAAALKKAGRDSETRQLHLLDPMTLEAAGNFSAAPPPKRSFEEGNAHPPWRQVKLAKGGKGKGAGKGKGGSDKGKKKDGLWTKVGNDFICFAWQKGGDPACDGSCQMRHLCQQCLGQHPLSECINRPKKKGPDTAAAAPDG